MGAGPEMWVEVGCVTSEWGGENHLWDFPTFPCRGDNDGFVLGWWNHNMKHPLSPSQSIKHRYPGELLHLWITLNKSEIINSCKRSPKVWRSVVLGSGLTWPDGCRPYGSGLVRFRAILLGFSQDITVYWLSLNSLLVENCMFRWSTTLKDTKLRKMILASRAVNCNFYIGHKNPNNGNAPVDGVQLLKETQRIG